MRIHYLTFAQYGPSYLSFNIFTASKGSSFYILFAISTTGVVPCSGPKNSPRTSSIVQIIFFFRSFELSKNIQKSVCLEQSSKQYYKYLNPFRHAPDFTCVIF